MKSNSLKVLVLMGGDTPERAVSLRSGAAVSSAAEEAGFEVRVYDPADGDEGLRDAVQSVDVVLPIVHGINGEDGVLQQKLEDLGAKYLGADSSASAHAFNKLSAHKILEKHGILMPHYAVVSSMDSDHALFRKPFVLKPIKGGSSIDTLVAKEVDSTSIKKARDLLLKYDEMLVEELIEGQEITVPVLGDDVLSVIAIIPPVGEEFNYENKYNAKSQELCPAPKQLVLASIQKQAQVLAMQVHRALHIRHLSRTDMIVRPDGHIYVLELNTMPGMADVSLLPKAAKAAGLTMPQLVKVFVELIG